MKFLSASALAATLSTGVLALTPAEWRTQTIYQVMTDRFARNDGSTTYLCQTHVQKYCGGTWRGIIDKLDYIQGLGATAVWISPFVKNIQGSSMDGESYHGYWAQDIYQVNPSFGTPDDLKDLSDALHARGMYLMADVVTNHMGWFGPPNTTDYSIYRPFHNASAYHVPPCWINYDDQDTVERCWQGSNEASLPDLRTEDPHIRKVFNAWIHRMVRRYGFDGLRLDSAKHVEKSFWPGFEASAGVFAIGEVFHGDPAYVVPYQDFMSGVMNLPVYYWVTQAFQSTTGSIWNLANGVKTLASTARDLTLWGGFLESHDQPRFLSHTSDKTLLKNALTFTLLMDGIPIIYQGLEQGYTGGGTPLNREALWLSGYNTESELYRWIQKLIGLRSAMIAQDRGYVFYKALPIYTDDHIIAMRKGFDGSQVVSVYSNVGGNRTFGVALGQEETGFRPCKLIMEITKCRPFVTDSSGVLRAESGSGGPLVFVPAERVMGTGICPGGIGKPPPPRPPSRARHSNPPPSATTSIAFESTVFNLALIGRFNNMTSSCLASPPQCLNSTDSSTNDTTATNCTLPVTVDKKKHSDKHSERHRLRHKLRH
ncbi:alpha-amylase [Colletotrichum truncatum]|uniref:Alpha-amylase n=1 Tax=Colletotrichum truncatum TaxID=5467 RepID=A0ACC3Z439_COLTU|nr:alpha-amylase [Colletotrichum truncatum]KAF6795728.1 alpha-amylase [Colletotrichum truncatum]